MSSTHDWHVATVELTGPLPQLDHEPGRAGIWVIFAVSGVPLGHTQIPAADLPIAPDHLAILAASAVSAAVGDRVLAQGFRSATPGLPAPCCTDPVGALRSLIGLEDPVSRLVNRLSETDQAPERSITVAICTRERPVPLERCLHSILASSLPPHQLLVIDNAPASDATAAVVARFPGVQYHREPAAGLSAARNTALALATGDVVAFADDDVVVHRDWLARIRAGFSDPNVMVTTGLVLPAELETESQLIFEKSFQFFHQGYRRRYFDSGYFAALRRKGVPVWQIGAGANMAIRRVAYELGYRFCTGLGPGVFGGCGEDSEFWYRILADGWSCLYEPAACVYHYHRRELGGLRHLLHQYMKGHVAALILQFTRYRDIGNLRRLVLQLPAEYLVLLLRSIATGFSKDCRMLLGGALGCAAGLRFAFLRKGAYIQRT